MFKVKVIPLSTKMRNKVKMHGEIWISKGFDGERTHITTTVPVHKGGHPYEIWVSKNDCKLEVIGKIGR